MSRPLPSQPPYSEEEIDQALAAVYDLLIRAARRRRLAEAQAHIAPPPCGDAHAPRCADDTRRNSGA